METDTMPQASNVTIMPPQGGAAAASRPGQTLLSFRTAIKDAREELSKMLPAHIPVERFLRVVDTAVQQNPKILEATPRSIFNAAMKAATDGLLPDGREGAIVPYNMRKKDAGGNWYSETDVQWMPMIAGLRKKVRNSGEIETWDAQVVYENDEFDYQLGDNPFIHHKPNFKGGRGGIIAAYSIAKLKSGELSREVMSIGEIEGIRERSKAKDSGPWKTDYSEMCRKTVARRHSKVLPMSTDLDDLMRRDDALYDFSPDQVQSEQNKTIERRASVGLVGKLQALGNTSAHSNSSQAAAANAASEDPASSVGLSPGTDEADGVRGEDAGASRDAAAAAPQASVAASSAAPASDPVSAAWEQGSIARERGEKRVVPKEYRDFGKDAEYDAWVRGFEGEAL